MANEIKNQDNKQITESLHRSVRELDSLTAIDFTAII